jgi:hypothetical protein
MHRYWFKFVSNKPYDYLHQLGCGVTARNYDDAVSILRETVFADEELPTIKSVVEDIELSALDQEHVTPNMEPSVWRGLWFPKDYTGL